MMLCWEEYLQHFFFTTKIKNWITFYSNGLFNDRIERRTVNIHLLDTKKFMRFIELKIGTLCVSVVFTPDFNKTDRKLANSWIVIVENKLDVNIV